MIKQLKAGILICLVLALGGCAVENIPYPTLSTPKKITKRLLSSDEQAEVIRDLSAEQATHTTSAIKTIEKSQ